MSKLKLKSAFIIGSSESAKLMRNFITTEMKIETTKEWSYCGRDVIDVPKSDYERVLLEGQQYVLDRKLSYVSWLNHYNELVNCGYLQLAYAILNKNEEGDMSWCIDEYLPMDILEYLKRVRKALGVNVHQTYNSVDNALCLQPQSLDYQKQLELMSAFIEQEGTGPFQIIKPMTFTGQLQNEKSFPIKVKK